MLTPQQLSALKAYIEADQVLGAIPETADGGFAVAAALAQPTSPAVIVWKTSVVVDEIMRNGLDWARVDNLSVGKARVWDWMSRLGSFDASKPNIRAGIEATWVGTAADLAVRAMVYTHCKRTASRVEALFATGTGTTEAPATMTFEGALTYQDVLAAWAS
jgi:hypothetical protein